MADYYPLLVRAISGLAQNTGETRKIVFDRARAALLKQLRSVDPPLPEGEIGRERLGLEEAIRRIEADYAHEAPPAPPPPPRPEPRREAAPHAPLTPRRERHPEDTTEIVRAAGRPSFSRAASPPPTMDEPPPAETEPVDTSESEAEAEADAARRPRIGGGKVRSRTAAREAQDGEGGTPWTRIAVFLLLAVLILGGIALGVVKRDAIAGLFGSSAPQTAATTPAAPAAVPDQPKSSDRVTQAPADASRRPAAATTSPRNPNAQTTQRAILYEESPGNAQALQQFEGTVTWKTETVNGGPGLPPDIGIRADIQIPERKIGVSFTLRRNLDQTLPASHTIEISFNLPPDFPYGGISNVPGVRVKQTEQAQGAPLAGLSVRVSPTYFLVGLSAVPVDRQRNLQLLQTRPWIDIPIVYTNNKRAILAFEKGPVGEQAFQDAFSAWGELYQAPPPPIIPQPDAN